MPTITEPLQACGTMEQAMSKLPSAVMLLKDIDLGHYETRQATNLSSQGLWQPTHSNYLNHSFGLLVYCSSVHAISKS